MVEDLVAHKDQDDESECKAGIEVTYCTDHNQCTEKALLAIVVVVLGI